MRIDLYNDLFAPVYTTLTSWLSELGQRVQAVWLRIWGETPAFQYAFSQQSSADCHLQAWTNFHRLQELRDRHPTRKIVLDDADFKAHRLWLAQSTVHFQHWLAAGKKPCMQEFITHAHGQAPCAPQIFDSSGEPYCSGSWNPFENAERRAFSPAFLQQVSREELAYTLPLFEEQDNYFCYNQTSRRYEEVGLRNRLDELSPANLILSDGQRASLPDNFDSVSLVKLPGRTRFIQAIDPELERDDGCVPRHLGTYKLLLLNLGLDASHQAIADEHPQAPIVRELQATMLEKNTPWSALYCRKENLIECALATLFQQDHELGVKVQRHVDFFFRIWGRYEEELPSLRDGQGRRFNQELVDQYLPGKEQMLAYCLMKNIQFLWVSAISSNAFCRHMGLPKIAQWIPLIPGPSQYRKAAYQVKEGRSFIEVWREVASRLQEAYPQQQDWVSFSGHGMVFSFDPELIGQQNERSISDPQLAEDLGIAGIDSLYGKEMDLFYRRPNPLQPAF